MNPQMASAFMGGAGGLAGGSSSPLLSSATATAQAGSGSMTFGGSKTQTFIIFGAVALIGFLILKARK